MAKQQNTHWIRTLQTARDKGPWHGWFDVPGIYTAKTAAQLCCDIRHHRRIQGFKPGEGWDANWYRHDVNDDSMCYVIIKWLPDDETVIECHRLLLGAKLVSNIPHLHDV